MEEIILQEYPVLDRHCRQLCCWFFSSISTSLLGPEKTILICLYFCPEHGNQPSDIVCNFIFDCRVQHRGELQEAGL